MTELLTPGTAAPDFTLKSGDGDEVTLADLRGQTSVLVFYPMDWSPVCTDQFGVYQEVLDDLEAEGARLYGVSVDSAWTHNAFRRHLGVDIPLLSDFHPKGEVSEAYGAYTPKYGVSKRALVMIGPDLTVEWSHKSPSPLEIPGANLIFDALEAHANA